LLAGSKISIVQLFWCNHSRRMDNFGGTHSEMTGWVPPNPGTYLPLNRMPLWVETVTGLQGHHSVCENGACSSFCHIIH
jgi:hypothetical protein